MENFKTTSVTWIQRDLPVVENRRNPKKVLKLISAGCIYVFVDSTLTSQSINTRPSSTAMSLAGALKASFFRKQLKIFLFSQRKRVVCFFLKSTSICPLKETLVAKEWERFRVSLTVREGATAPWEGRVRVREGGRKEGRKEGRVRLAQAPILITAVSTLPLSQHTLI